MIDNKFWLFDFPEYEYRYSILTASGDKYMVDSRGRGYRYGNVFTDPDLLNSVDAEVEGAIDKSKKLADLLMAWKKNGGKEYGLEVLNELPIAVLDYIRENVYSN